MPKVAQSKLSMFSILRSFSLLNGRNGSNAMARLATSCREMFRIVATRSISVLAIFQGSVSARYLFPMRARFMASFCASRNLNTSSNFSTSAFTSENSFSVSRSYSVNSPAAGTTPSKYFLVSCRARFTKLP